MNRIVCLPQFFVNTMCYKMKIILFFFRTQTCYWVSQECDSSIVFDFVGLNSSFRGEKKFRCPWIQGF